MDGFRFVVVGSQVWRFVDDAYLLWVAECLSVKQLDAGPFELPSPASFDAKPWCRLTLALDVFAPHEETISALTRANGGSR